MERWYRFCWNILRLRIWRSRPGDIFILLFHCFLFLSFSLSYFVCTRGERGPRGGGIEIGKDVCSLCARGELHLGGGICFFLWRRSWSWAITRTMFYVCLTRYIPRSSVFFFGFSFCLGGRGGKEGAFLLLFFLLYLHGLGNECSLYLAEVGPVRCVCVCFISSLFILHAAVFFYPPPFPSLPLSLLSTLPPPLPPFPLS